MSVLTCASCGFAADDQFRFCTSCGAVLQRAAEVTSAAEESEQPAVTDAPPTEVVAQQGPVVDAVSNEGVAEQTGPITCEGVEPMFTFKYERDGRQREVRLYETYVTWHELAYEEVDVIPYRSIQYLECAGLSDGEHVVFMRIANPNINFAITGSAADIAAITERLTHLIA